MKISKNAFVSLVYELHSGSHEGPLVEKCDESRPLGFVFGAGRMLPFFESNLEGLSAGDTFRFSLSPEQAYGEVREEGFVELPKDTFVVNGQLMEQYLQVGARVPMFNDQGQRIIGRVLEVADDKVRMDFNHELAGETLCFTGSVLEVRDATVDELLGPEQSGCGGGCGGCHGSCGGDDGECGDGGCCGGCH